MKKIIAFILVCTMLLAGLSLPVQAQEIDGLVEVNTVDQLLDAIRPGAVIQLLPGDYVLPQAKGYGTARGEYWSWVDCYDGFELQIENVDGLTILAPEGTQLLTDPRYANVLLFRNCSHIEINGLTLGHTPEKGACCGGVVMLEGCTDVKLESCVLFGCGVTALIAYDSEGIELSHSTLTDCSYSGAELSRCENVWFHDCTFSGNGVGEEYTGSALYVDSSRYVTVMNCSFTGNATQYMLSGNASFDVALLGCTFSENTFDGFFYLEAVDVTVVNCSFGGLNAGNAYAAAYNPGRILDANGAELSYDALLLMKQIPAQVRPAPAQKNTANLTAGATNQHYYEVSTADEFIAAIGSHRVICLTKDIDLSTASNYGIGYSDCWRWETTFDGGAQLVISNVKGLTVTARQPGVTLLTSPRTAAVLTFSNCRDVTVEGLSAGHTEMPGYACTGAVLVFYDSIEIEIEDCALFGCGTVGVEAYNCRELDIEDTEIYDCTLGGIYLCGVQEAEIENCSIHDCAFPALFIDADSRDIEVDGKAYQPGDYDRI